MPAKSNSTQDGRHRKTGLTRAEGAPAPAGRVTMREVASAAGVHYSTVSLALRNSPRIPVATRRKVQKIAERLHYQPDPMLASLNAYRLARRPTYFQGTLAWLNNWPGSDDLQKNFTFKEYFQSASKRASELGYKLDEFWLRDPKMSPQKFVATFRARNIQGLLLPPQPLAHTPIKIDCSSFSVMSFGYSLSPASFHLVTNHQFHCVNLMLENLDALGYRRIGVLLMREWDEKADNGYLSSLLVAQSRHRLRGQLFSHITPGHPKEADFKRWFRKCQPDVVVTLSVQKQIAQWVRDLGLRIPRDIGLATLGVAKNDKILSGIRQNNDVIGSTAVDYLVSMIQRGECGVPAVPIRILVENTWCPGQTLRRISRHKHSSRTLKS